MINFLNPSQGDNIFRDENRFREKIIGSRRISNYFCASVILLGASGFLIVGLSSYLQFNLVFFLDAKEIVFFPQGIVMCFYGTAGILLSIYQWLVIFWKVGEGFNEFDKNKGIMRIFRWGFPGKNREIDLVYSIEDIEAVRVEIKEGVNPSRTIFIRIKGKPNIPLTQVGAPLPLSEIEKKAAELASFLQVSIEGLIDK